jgi:hypothetical protein
VAAHIRGSGVDIRSLDDVELELALSVDSLELPRPDDPAKPEQARFVRRWKRLADFYRHFEPRGRFDLEIAATKTAGVDEKFDLRHARLTARGGSASCLWAPYRAEDLRGSIEFQKHAIFLHNLRGHHDGGFVTVDGWLAGPTYCSEAELFITGERIAFDEYLYAGMPQRFARVIQQFDPCGEFGFSAEMRRGPCVDGARKKWETVIDGGFNGISAVYEHFSYPLGDLTGEVSMANDRLRAYDVRARTANGEGEVSVDADADFSEPSRPIVEVEVKARNLEIDRALIGALPLDVAGLVTHLHPTGRSDWTC